MKSPQIIITFFFLFSFIFILFYFVLFFPNLFTFRIGLRRSLRLDSQGQQTQRNDCFIFTNNN